MLAQDTLFVCVCLVVERAVPRAVARLASSHSHDVLLIFRLQRILPPKMSFFVRQKVQISFLKKFATNPEFCQFFAIRK